MATLFRIPDRTAFNSNGLPSAGAKAYFYTTGTTTAEDVYTTSGLTTAHANPVVADSAGRFAPIYLDPTVTYKFVLKDKDDVQIGSTIDPYAGPGTELNIAANVTGSGSDEASALQADINTAEAAGGGTVVLPFGVTVSIGSTINIEEKVTLDLNGSTVSPLTDIRVFNIKEDGRLQHGIIDVSGITGFSNECIYISAIERPSIPNSIYCRDLDVIGDNSVASPTGTGIKLHAPGTNASDRITFCNFDRIYVDGFSKGIHLHCEHPSSGDNWINSNRFTNTTIYGCLTFVDLERSQDSGTAVNANYFDIHCQPRTAAMNAVSAVRCDGEYNEFRGHVWDWYSTSVVADVEAVKFTSLSGRNTMGMGGIDYLNIRDDVADSNQRNNYVDQRGTAGNYLQTEGAGPFVRGNHVPVGQQDNALAGATGRFTVVQSSGSAVSTGSLADAFSTDPNGFARWNSLNGSVVIDVDLGASYAGLLGAGVTFYEALDADTVKIEYGTSGYTDATLFTKTTVGGQNYAYLARDTIASVRYIRFTLTTTSSKDIAVYSFYGWISTLMGGWVPRDGGTAEGQIDLAGGMSVGGGGAISGILRGSAANDFASIAAAGVATFDITVTGTTTADLPFVHNPGINNGLILDCYVQAADTVRVRAYNPTAGAIDPSNKTYKVIVIKG